MLPPSNMTTLVAPLVGGAQGPAFNDLEKMTKDGVCKMNMRNPIKQIKVGGGWVIDGIEITYNLADGQTQTCLHGSQPTKWGNNFVDLKPTERVACVFGRAGMQDYYKRKFVNSIGFAIFDEQTCTTRVCGPWGNGNGSNNGTPFCMTDVCCFSGYAEEKQELGLSGLCCQSMVMQLIPMALTEQQ